jgi:lipoprotein-anchoring transpeptidase ErfK/SrfK
VVAVSFHGYEPVDGKLDRGWIVTDAAPLYSEPAGHRLASRARRFEPFTVLETSVAQGQTWLRIAEGTWLDEADARLPRLSEPPAEARPGERWLDVDLTTQVVTAYEGRRPVYTTLASTGIGKGDDVTATPVGVHRVWVKLRTTDMTNLEDAEAARYYAIEEVPWVLFFKKGYGFHGAFWHRSFGKVRSHGCVNLTPLDAERLFRWASPHLPAGWTAVLPTAYDPGTLVRVR